MSADLTKAELLDVLTRTRHERDKAHEALTDIDKEARAIGRCVDALDRIKPQSRTGYSYDPVSARAADSAVGRVLHYLAERYGVPLVEVRTEVKDCDRPHLEDASEGQLTDALKWQARR